MTIYTQFTNPIVTGEFNLVPAGSYPVSGGTYSGSDPVLPVDSNYVIAKGYCIVTWTGTDASSGTLTITGVEVIF